MRLVGSAARAPVFCCAEARSVKVERAAAYLENMMEVVSGGMDEWTRMIELQTQSLTGK